MNNIPRGFKDALNTLQEASGEPSSAPKATPPSLEPGSSEEEREKAFKEALTALCDEKISLDSEAIDGFVSFFANCYCSDNNRFRHRYSDICEVMFSELNANKLDNGVPFNVIALENNITMLKEIAERRPVSQCAIDGLKKLQDHITLEKHRMQYMTTQNKSNQKIADELSKEFEEKINSSLAKADESFKKIEETKDSLQKNYVTILGIFAAVVIAFMSATAFSSSVLESMKDVSIYRLSFTMLVLGFFVFNLLCALFAFLGKVSNTNTMQKVFVVAVDSVFVLLIVLTILARFFHVLG